MMTDNVKTTPRVGFWEATVRGFKGVLDFEGRARRSEFWWYILAVYLLLCLLLIGVMSYIVASGNYVKGHDYVGTFSWFDTLLMLSATFLPYALCFSIQVRRLHDVGQGALWPCISFVTAFFTMLFWAIGIESMISGVDWFAVTDNFLADLLVLVGYISWMLFLIAQIIIIVNSLKDSQAHPNKYGDSPKYIVR